MTNVQIDNQIETFKSMKDSLKTDDYETLSIKSINLPYEILCETEVKLKSGKIFFVYKYDLDKYSKPQKVSCLS